jgi:pSer/pThr/pTyr-binding forkhead associated (FHA) protein
LTVFELRLTLARSMGIRLTVRSGWTRSGAEAVYEFDQDRIVVGRGSGADVRLPHRAVSAIHATLRAHGQGHAIVDEDSTNGTRVNGTRITPGRLKPLRDGDAIDIGGFRLDVAQRAVAEATSADRTAALARQLVREMLEGEGEEPTPPRVSVLNGPEQGEILYIPAPPVRLLVGRGDGCELVLSDGDASREHVELLRDLDGVLVRDLGSKNGLEVNGRRLTERRLRDRDELVVGATALLFEEPAEAQLRALEEEPDLETLLPLEADPSAEQPFATPQPKREPGPDDSAAAARSSFGTTDERDAVAGGPEESPGASEPSTVHPDAARLGEVSGEGSGEATGEGAEGTGVAGEPTGADASRRRASRPATDLLIYGLAAVVLAASLLGLFLLLRAG